MIGAVVGCLTTLYFHHPEPIPVADTKKVTAYLPVEVEVEVLPALPECANFNFDPDISGIDMSELILYTAKLYQWGAGCNNALASAKAVIASKEQP